ncbi:hypothetical protein [Azotobacter salinestris]|uniref:hypothetical protein n=1 Tax=Azotobacter salinestris TaxID=69964 RepID=UPI0032DF86FF
MKSSIALYQALKSIDVSDERATAVVDALEADMQTHLATKADIQALASDIKAVELSTKADIAQLESKLTIRMGVMLSAAVGIMLAGLRLMLP